VEGLLAARVGCSHLTEVKEAQAAPAGLSGAALGTPMAPGNAAA